MSPLRHTTVTEMRGHLPHTFSASEAASWLSSRQYRAPLKALRALEREGSIVRLKQGLYTFLDGFEPFAAAAMLHGPSYVSFETALAHYGLIPEQVLTIMSVVDGRPATFDTPLGRFEYSSQSRLLFAEGMDLIFLGGEPCPIANREKALLDTIARTRLKASGHRPAQVLHFVQQGLRVDEATWDQLSLDKLARMATMYRSTAPKKLVQALEELR